MRFCFFFPPRPLSLFLRERKRALSLLLTESDARTSDQCGAVGTREGVCPSAASARAFVTLSGSLSETCEPLFFKRGKEGVEVEREKKRGSRLRERRKARRGALRESQYGRSTSFCLLPSPPSLLHTRLHLSLFSFFQRLTNAHDANLRGDEGFEERWRQVSAKAREHRSRWLFESEGANENNEREKIMNEFDLFFLDLHIHRRHLHQRAASFSSPSPT